MLHKWAVIESHIEKAPVLAKDIDGCIFYIKVVLRESLQVSVNQNN